MTISGPAGQRMLLALVASGLLPALATAQPRFNTSGSVTFTESYDDNVFAVPDDRRPDVVSRLGARLGVGYWSPRFQLRLQGAREAEAFRRNPELTTSSARQEARVDLDWSPWAGLEAVGTATYVETHSPGEFAVVSDLSFVGFELRRTLANRLSTTGSLTQRLGARTRAVVTHGFTEDEIVGGATSATQVATARLDRQVGPLDSVSLAYGIRRLAALGDGSTSQTATVTWARDVTSQAHIELKAGPRFAEGTVAPELAFTLRHRFARGEAALAYVQTETALIGRTTPITAEGLSATLTRSLSRTLTLTAAPSVFQARGRDLEATVYGMNLDLDWRLGRHVTLGASHQLSVQHGELDGIQRGEIVHNTVLLRLVAGPTH
jgi:hypothetical protein